MKILEERDVGKRQQRQRHQPAQLFDNCIDDDLRAITPRLKVVMLGKRRDLLYGVRVLVSSDAVIFEGKVGGSVGSLLPVLSSDLSSVSSVLLYHHALAASILWKIFTTTSWVPGE